MVNKIYIQRVKARNQSVAESEISVGFSNMGYVGTLENKHSFQGCSEYAVMYENLKQRGY